MPKFEHHDELGCSGTADTLLETDIRLRRIIRERDIFDSIPRVRRAPGDPMIHYHTCLPGPEVRRLGKLADYTRCSGAGLTEHASSIAAAAEGLERYCAIRFSLDTSAPSCYAASEALPTNTKALEDWCIFSDRQYNSPDFVWRPLSARTAVYWYSGLDLMSGATKLLPGPLVCFPYRRRRSEDRIAPSTTTGLAFGIGAEHAYRSALWEVIERDAIVLAWHWGIPVVRIDSETGLLPQLARRAELDERYTVYAYDITSDLLVPSSMVFITVQEKHRRLLAAGAASRGSIQDALEKAFLEALQGVPYVRYLCQKFEGRTFESFSDIQSFEHGAAYYTLFPEMLDQYLSNTDQFLNATRTVSVPGLAADRALDLSSTIDRLRTLGYAAYVVDMAPQWLRDEGCFVVRALVPGLYALEGAYDFRHGHQSRAIRVADSLGVSVSVNPFPHPLP